MIDITTILNESEKINLEVKKAAGGVPNSLWVLEHVMEPQVTA